MRKLILASIIFSLSTFSFATTDDLMRRKSKINESIKTMDCVKFKQQLPSLAQSNLGEIKFSKPGSESYELAIYTIDMVLKKSSKCIK